MGVYDAVLLFLCIEEIVFWLQDQSTLIWKYRDGLQKEVSTQAMRGLLEYNNQNVVNGESDLLNRVSDCMAFGALSRCPECKDGQLVFRYVHVNCYSEHVP